MNRQEGAPAASSLHSTVLKPEEVLHRRAGKTAIKALYALQLDLAAIDLLLKEDGSCQVVSIHLPTHQKLPDQTWDWEAVVQRISERWRSSKSIRSAAAKPILVGADPEFLLMSAEGKVVPAHRYLGDGYGAGTDTVYIGGKIVRIVAELRPAPAETVDVLMARIRKLLQQAASRINDPTLRLAAGAMPAPGLALGGHIHLSGVELTPRLLRLLDSYVAFPLAMVESAGGRSRRPRYGCLGDTKLQQHGGFEYRTLPSWLLSPMLAQASIALSMLCAHEQRNLIYCPAEEDVYVEAYYSGDRNRLYQCLEPLEASMRHTAAYAELAPYIDPFIASLRRREIWDESADLRKAWRLPPFQVDRG
nr:hypothetical protein [Paenibacillus phyllosphaerae]